MRGHLFALFTSDWDSVTVENPARPGFAHTFEKVQLRMEWQGLEKRDLGDGSKLEGYFLLLTPLEDYSPLPHMGGWPPYGLALFDEVVTDWMDVWSNAPNRAGWRGRIRARVRPQVSLQVWFPAGVVLVRIPFEFRDVSLPRMQPQ